jgi:potassium/chloride transporter 9
LFHKIDPSALYLAACTEGLVSNFGLDGSLVQVLPQGPWWNFGYASLINVVNLVVCLFGAKLFGRTSVFVLLVSMYCVFYSSF